MRLPSRTPLPTRTLLALVVAAGCLVAVPAIAAGQEQPTSTPDSSAVQPTQPTTPPTQPTTAPTTATTRPTTPTTQPTTSSSSSTSSSTTTSTSSTTTTTPSTTTAADTDEDGGSNLGWLLWAVLALAVVLALVWLVSALMSRRTAAKQWDQRRDALLDEARHAHDGTVDLLARWSNLEPSQLQARWSEEMAHLERLRSHSSSLLAHAPAGSDARPVEDIAMAVDDVHVALGNASVDPQTPPPYVADAAATLEQTVNAAQHPAGHR